MKLLQIDFPFDGPFGEEMTQSLEGLANSIANEKGLVWKIWTENKETKEAGGIYLFESYDLAQEYLAMHTKRLESFGINSIRSKIFDVNVPLSLIDRAKLS